MEAWELPRRQSELRHFPGGRFLLQLSPTDDPDSVYVYDLMATVVHILDSRTGGSLVGHIKVGETYHQRKEVRSPAGMGALPLTATVPTGCRERPRSRESCLAEALLPTARSGVGLFGRPIPGSLGQALSVWLNGSGSPKQPSATGHLAGRAGLKKRSPTLTQAGSSWVMGMLPAASCASR